MQLTSFAFQIELFAFLAILPLITAHTWVEQLMAIAPNGTMVGQPGFPRNNVLRTAAGFNDGAMVFLIPPNGGPANKIDANQLMCRPEQTVQTQSTRSPRLKATPGQAVALRYQENGHVTLPQNQPGKPKGGGVNFVYFTNDSKPDDKFLQIHRQWNADGSGGDGRGKLISTQNFDDGQCYQINGDKISLQRQTEFQHESDKLQGQALWCQQDIQIPADAQPGTTVTLYWVWDWPTMPGTPGFPEGKQEIYTTCMDIDVVAAPNTGSIKAVAKGFVKQDLANAAVAAQFADIANPTAVKPQLIPFSNINAASTTIAGTQSTSARASRVLTSNSSAQPSALSTSSTIDGDPREVTVTVTVTATVSPKKTRTEHRHAITVTATETSFVTVRVTSAVAAKRNIDSDVFSVMDSDSDTPKDANPNALTFTATTTGKENANATATPSRLIACSTSHKSYRLRARNPFYVLPLGDQPVTTASTGC